MRLFARTGLPRLTVCCLLPINKLLRHAMAGKPGLSQATADRCAQAGPILHPTTPRRRQFTNPFRLAAVLAVVLVVVDVCWLVLDMVWPP